MAQQASSPSDSRVNATDGRDITLAGYIVACAKANIRREGEGFDYGSAGRFIGRPPVKRPGSNSSRARRSRGDQCIDFSVTKSDFGQDISRVLAYARRWPANR